MNRRTDLLTGSGLLVSLGWMLIAAAITSAIADVLLGQWVAHNQDWAFRYFLTTGTLGLTLVLTGNLLLRHRTHAKDTRPPRRRHL